MGYYARSFQDMVQPWLDAGWLRPRNRLIEMGAQEFYADPDEVRREVSGFLEGRGIGQRQIADTLGTGMPLIRRIYEALDVQYDAIDVDGAHGSTFFDLNAQRPPPGWCGAFDFVNNEGTIEHLVNPINDFHVAHDLAKVGGVIRHAFPLIGWREHGFLYPTTKFYAHMVGDNGYEVLRAAATIHDATPFDDPPFSTVTDQRGERSVHARHHQHLGRADLPEDSQQTIHDPCRSSDGAERRGHPRSPDPELRLSRTRSPHALMILFMIRVGWTLLPAAIVPEAVTGMLIP